MEFRAQLPECSLDGPIAQVHMRDCRQVDLGAFDLADGCAQDLAALAGGSLLGKLDDGVSHASKLGRGV
jgi:hypothetical protein